MLSKPAIKIAIEIIQKGVRQKNKSVATTHLSNKFGIGKYSLIQKCYLYDAGDVDTLKIILSREGVDSAQSITFDGSRNDVAVGHVNEKHSNEAVFSVPICIKVLSEGCQVNDIKLTHTGLAHVQSNITDIHSINAECLVMVENLETFKRLDDVFLPAMPKKTLYLWRGGPIQKNGAQLSIPNTEKQAKYWRTQFQLKIGYFGDYDLKGLSIGIELKRDILLLQDINEMRSRKLKGNMALYDKQREEFAFKRKRIIKYELVKEYVDLLESLQVGFTQERISAHNINHSWITLK